MPDRDDKLIFEGYQRILEKMEKIEAADYIVNVLSSDVTNAEVIKKNILIALDGMNSAEKNDVLVALGDRDDGGVRKLPDEKYQDLINTFGCLVDRVHRGPKWTRSGAVHPGYHPMESVGHWIHLTRGAQMKKPELASQATSMNR